MLSNAHSDMLKGRHDARIQEECSIAAAIMREFPEMKRSEALREAAIIRESRNHY